MPEPSKAVAIRGRKSAVTLGKAFDGKFKRRERIIRKVEWKNGIYLNLSFLPRPQLQKIWQDSRVLKRNELTDIREEVSDPMLVAQNTCDRCVDSWEGLTPRKLADIIEIDTEGMTDEDLDVEIPFDPGEMANLYREAYDLDEFIQKFVTNLRNFRPHHEAEVENSESSPNGN